MWCCLVFVFVCVLFCDCVWSMKCMCVLFANDCVMVYGLCYVLWVVVCVMVSVLVKNRCVMCACFFV